jgi:hypothetical protein
MREFLMRRVHILTSHITKFFMLEPLESYRWLNTTGMFLGRMYTRYQHKQKNIAREFLSFTPYFINETPITSELIPSIGRLPSIL